MKLLISTLLILISIYAHGQNANGEIYDTAKRIDPYATDRELLTRNFTFPLPKDSSMLYLQQYDKAKREHIAIQSLGDVSSPYIQLLFQPFTEMGFVTGIHPFGTLFYRKEEATFYNARLPYTEFYYSQGKAGTRGMIYFDAMHTQNFGKQFNISAKYHSTSNDGFYKRQTINAFKNIQANAYFHSKNDRYLAFGIVTWNKAKFQENGGLERSPENDTQFRSLSPAIRIVDVELNTAANINRLREHEFNQTYWLKVKYLKDTGKTMVPQIGINHSFSAFKQSNYYTDQSADYGYYDSVYYLNAGYSADSIGFVQYSNKVQVFSPIKATGSSFRAGIQYDRFTYYQQRDPVNYYRLRSHNLSIDGQLRFSFLKTFHSELNGQYFLEGYNQTDYLLTWKNEAMIWKTQGISVNGTVMASSRRPFFQQQRMFSNHYQWSNNFAPTAQKTISFGIDKSIRRPSVYNAYYYTLPPKFLSLRASYSLVDQMMYYGLDGKPAQGTKGQNSLQLYGMAHLHVRKIHLHQELAYQVFSRQLSSVLLLPAFMSKSSLYFQSYAFRKATFVQIGFDVNFTSDYQAKLYNPGTLNFQLSEKHVGAYPFIDFFVNAEIKTARIFLKVEHINQLAENFTAGSNYAYSFPNYLYVSPYQPSAPVRLRLGFAWKFYY